MVGFTEMQVCELLSRGECYTRISEELGLSEDEIEEIEEKYTPFDCLDTNFF